MKKPGIKRIEIEMPEIVAIRFAKFARNHGLSIAAMGRYCMIEEMDREEKNHGTHGNNKQISQG